MTRVSLSALVGAVALTAGLFAVSAPVQAACVGIASCANAGGNRFATNPGAARPGVNVARPGPGFNGAGVIGQNGANVIGQNGANFNGSRVIGNNGTTFR